MRLFHSSYLALLIGVIITALAERCLYGRLNRFASAGSLNAAGVDVPPDAYIGATRKDDNEGEDHTPLQAPKGCELTSIKVLPESKEEIAVFQTKGLNKTSISHVYIAIHGKLRNGDHYWKVFHHAAKAAYKAGYPGVGPNDMVVAPEFFSKRYNSGQYTDDQLAWGDVNAWEAAEKAIHPKGTNFTSIDAIDAIVREFSDRATYPSLTNVTVVGHGGGGQLVQRYAALAALTDSHVHVRYIHGDPSSCVYFTDDRPTSKDIKLPKKSKCKGYNTWRYGFDGFPADEDMAQEAFRRYTSRDVISIVGYQDIENNGDQTCMARTQGGDRRRDRNLVWYRYIHTLARTGADVDGFPGRFDDLPDWGHLANNSAHLRLIVVENATHDASEVFGSQLGRSALFGHGHVQLGWRPGKDKH
ncbi:hypothetical protein BX600DRAFT_522723 [Xylariales sp. PMI_506]|nr:hypothetical protein BX600DRAFT_522723 [Xylariales sp. PMI_506]